jgi:MFS family permease
VRYVATRKAAAAKRVNAPDGRKWKVRRLWLPRVRWKTDDPGTGELGWLSDAPGIGVVLSSSWNGLSFTAAAELAGRARSGAALGFQQTALSVAAATTPPLFALLVEQGSWALGFGLAALLPLAGIGLMRRLTV